jgi:hypothetical protein
MVKSIQVNVLSANFSIQNCLRQRDASSQLLFNFASAYKIRKVHKKSGGTKSEWNTSASGVS